MYLTVFLWGTGNSLITLFHWEGVESQHGLKAQLEGLVQWHPMWLQWGLVGAAWIWWSHPSALACSSCHLRQLTNPFWHVPPLVWGCHHHGVVARNAFDNPRIVPTSGVTNRFQLLWTPIAWSTVLRILVTMYLDSRKARWTVVMTGIGADGLGESVLSFPFPSPTSTVLKRTLCYETYTQFRSLCQNGASLEGCWSISENWSLVGTRRAVQWAQGQEPNHCQDMQMLRISLSPLVPSPLSPFLWKFIHNRPTVVSPYVKMVFQENSNS